MAPPISSLPLLLILLSSASAFSPADSPSLLPPIIQPISLPPSTTVTSHAPVPSLPLPLSSAPSTLPPVAAADPPAYSPTLPPSRADPILSPTAPTDPPAAAPTLHTLPPTLSPSMADSATDPPAAAPTLHSLPPTLAPSISNLVTDPPAAAPTLSAPTPTLPPLLAAPIHPPIASSMPPAAAPTRHGQVPAQAPGKKPMVPVASPPTIVSPPPIPSSQPGNTEGTSPSPGPAGVSDDKGCAGEMNGVLISGWTFLIAAVAGCIDDVPKPAAAYHVAAVPSLMLYCCTATKDAAVIVMRDANVRGQKDVDQEDEKKPEPVLIRPMKQQLEEFMLLKRDDGMPPIGTILAPLEAELKLARQEIGNLQDDNRALDCLTKSKDVALLDAEGIVQIALAKASMVDDLQSKNQ
ncbi:hypothetical protein J5N97_028571 [Dioscorea zingiberensis]|uniref:Uncharacterized protein n=1 Tax=Dioscorea zingiberensis TaxID=325984 RepID=A0A9D5BZF1_9LILI|nr:hypothetical protein J5N97_028571 [Dioscorea zingiberensis]